MVALASMRAALTPPWVRDPLWRRAQAVPSLDLRFASTRSLVDAVTGRSLVTFTRASNATFVDSSGTVTTAANDTPRFTHDPTTGASLGLLVEEARTNLALRSNEFNNSYWATPSSAVTISSAGAVGPLGAAWNVVPTAGTSTKTLVSGNIALPATHARYIYAKANGYRYLQLNWGGLFTATAFVNFDLQTGIVGTQTNATGGVISYPDGWYLVWAVATGTASNQPIGHTIVGSNTAALAATINGDGTSGILMAGAQIEAGSTPSSYIPTTTATVTRAADVTTVTGAGNITPATLRAIYAEFISPASGTRGIASLDDNSSNNRIELLTSTADPKLLVVSGGVTQADIDTGSVTANARTRLAATFATDAFAASVAGGAAVTDASGTVPTTDRLRIGALQAGNSLNGPIARLTLWNTAPNTATLTAP